MQVKLESVEDVKMVNWQAVSDMAADMFRKKLAEAFGRAAEELKELEPGESRMIEIDMPVLEISREAESEQSGITLVSKPCPVSRAGTP
jgi:hypothetical protein